MTTSNELTQKTSRLSGGIVAGGVLILIGMMSLVQNLWHVEFAVLPLLAAIFLFAGLLQKKIGLIIPGSILAGVSAGTALMDGNYLMINDVARGGVFFLALAGGFALISLLSLYTHGTTSWVRWPLFPAGGLALFGGALLAGEIGLKALELLGYAWPVILILVGVALIFRRK